MKSRSSGVRQRGMQRAPLDWLQYQTIDTLTGPVTRYPQLADSFVVKAANR